MKIIFIIIGIIGIGFNLLYSGKPSFQQPIDFKKTGPIALIVGIISLVLGIWVF